MVCICGQFLNTALFQNQRWVGRSGLSMIDSEWDGETRKLLGALDKEKQRNGTKGPLKPFPFKRQSSIVTT